MPKVSVVVPVYGVEKYIERCARSLFCQSLQDIEFIFVNDCTPDKSIEILKKVLLDYPSRQKYTRILSMPCNSGQALVRTKGMESATGDFVIHCDSDDWIDEDMYETMYNAAMENQADIVVCDFLEDFNGREKIYRMPNFASNPREVLQNAYKYKLHGSLCNKLIKRDLYVKHNIYPYPHIDMGEDIGVVVRVFAHAHRLYQIHRPFYHYFRANEKSLTNNNTSERILRQRIERARLTREYLLNIDKERYEIYTNFECYYVRLATITSNFSDLRRYRDTFPETEKYVRYFKKEAFTRNAYIRFWLVKHHLAFISILLFKLLQKKK